MHLVPDLWQVAVGEELGGENGEHFLLGHAEHQVGALAVLELEEVVAHEVISIRLLPDFGRVESREKHLLSANRIHLPTDDPHDFASHPLPERQHGVGAGGQLTDETTPDQQLMAHRLCIGGSVSQCWDMCL